MAKREPIFNVPGVVLAVLAVMAAVHVGRLLLDPADDVRFVYAMAFIPARFQGLAAELPGGETAEFTSWITHLFVHADALHLAFNSAWLLAFGGAIAQRVGTLPFLGFYSLTGMAGALTFLIVNPDLMSPVVGASGAVAGLMGGALRILFPALDSGGLRQLQEAPRSVKLMSLREAFTDRRLLFASAIMVLLNALMAVGLGSDMAPGGIAWEAHLGGYFAGLLTFGIFDFGARTVPQPNRD